MRAPSLLLPYNSPPSHPAVFYADPQHGISFRSTMPRFSRKNHEIIHGFEFAFAKNIDFFSSSIMRKKEVSIK